MRKMAADSVFGPFAGRETAEEPNFLFTVARTLIEGSAGLCAPSALAGGLGDVDQIKQTV